MVRKCYRPQTLGDAPINEVLRPLGAGIRDILGRCRSPRLADGFADPQRPWPRPVPVPGRMDLEITLSPICVAQDSLLVSIGAQSSSTYEGLAK